MISLSRQATATALAGELGLVWSDRYWIGFACCMCIGKVWMYGMYIALPAHRSCNQGRDGDERTHLSAQSRALLGAMGAGDDGREP